MAGLDSEKELEDFLFSSLDEHLDIDSRDVYQQVNIPGYGVIDLLAISIGNDWDRGCRPLININIIELKKGSIDLNALGQICRYKIAIERFFEDSKHYFNLKVNGVLVGSDYTSGDICYAVDSIDWLSCYHFSVDLTSGIDFEMSEGWHHPDEDFKKLNMISQKLLSDYLSSYRSFRRNFKADKIKNKGDT